MAVVPGVKRQSAASTRLRKTMAKLVKALTSFARRFTQRACTQCDPTEWVRTADWEIHRANYHRPGGYQYELRKQRAEQAKVAEKAQQEAVNGAANAAPPRPARPQSKTKPSPTKGKPTVATNGSDWTSPLAGRGQSNGKAGDGSQATQQQATSITEAVVESMRLWAMQTPPSIPASRVDAQAAADMWRGISDALRLRVRMEQENNKIPESCTEPLLDAARRASQIGDSHMEAGRRIQTRYGETATILARPDTPDSKYLEQGA